MIYLDKNGITIKASKEAVIGEEYELNGEKYKVVDEEMLRDMVENEEDSDPFELEMGNIQTFKITFDLFPR